MMLAHSSTLMFDAPGAFRYNLHICAKFFAVSPIQLIIVINFVISDLAALRISELTMRFANK